MARPLVLVFACLLSWLSSHHQAVAQSRLAEFIAQVRPQDLMPGADRFGPVEGQPVSVQVMAGSRLLG